jgi:hypothetical protein
LGKLRMTAGRKSQKEKSLMPYSVCEGER